MTRRVVLNNVDHHDLKVAPRAGGAGDRVNQVTVFPTEFEQIQREYPILFQRLADNSVEAVALLGLARDENLFLDGGCWRSRYIPALQRRGPFSIGLLARDDADAPEPMIHIDLDDADVGTAHGEPLFLPHGGNAPYLEQAAETLRTIYAGVELAKAMFAMFDALELIQPVALEIVLNDAERYDVAGYATIAQDRLAQLDGPALAQLHRAGFLQSAFLAASSLGNVERLIALKNAKR